MKKENTAESIIQRFSEQKTKRYNYDRVWQIISDYVLPNRGYFLIKPQAGFNKSKDLYNTTAVIANQNLASTLHSSLTNRGTKWFSAGLEGTKPNTDEERYWLDDTANRMLTILNAPSSAFPQNNHEVLTSLTSLGTACLFVEDSYTDGIKFISIHISQIYLLDNKFGEMDTVFRSFEMTGRQCLQKWKDGQLHPMMKDRAEQDGETVFKILHCVQPKEDYDNDFKGMPFESYYIDIQNNFIIEESGYFEMPYIVPRFSKLSGEIYGRSPAWDVLADIMMVNHMDKAALRMMELAAAPPIMTADDGVLGAAKISPNVVLSGALGSDGSPLIQPLSLGDNPGVYESAIARAEERIKKAYFDNLLISQGKMPEMTATEVMQRRDEQLSLLSPQIGRIESEYLNPLLDRVFGIMVRSKNAKTMLAPIPQSLRGKTVKFEYQSPLAKITKMNDVQALMRWYSSVGSLAQVVPGLFDILNPDRLGRETADDAGVPMTMLRTDAELKQLKDAQQKQQQMQQNAQMAQVAQTLTQSQKNINPGAV